MDLDVSCCDLQVGFFEDAGSALREVWTAAVGKVFQG